jgi:hypothetical protein
MEAPEYQHAYRRPVALPGDRFGSHQGTALPGGKDAANPMKRRRK